MQNRQTLGVESGFSDLRNLPNCHWAKGREHARQKIRPSEKIGTLLSPEVLSAHVFGMWELRDDPLLHINFQSLPPFLISRENPARANTTRGADLPQPTIGGGTVPGIPSSGDGLDP